MLFCPYKSNPSACRFPPKMPFGIEPFLFTPVGLCVPLVDMLRSFVVILSLLKGIIACVAQPEGLFDWDEANAWYPSIRHIHYTTSSP